VSVEWSEEYRSGVIDIDDDHREIVDWLGLLDAAAKGGASFSSLGRARDGLSNFARTHFDLEERYMVVFNYPVDERDRHEAAHLDFLQKIACLPLESHHQEEGQAPGYAMLQKVPELSKWLSDHFLGPDRALINFLKAQQSG